VSTVPVAEPVPGLSSKLSDSAVAVLVIWVPGASDLEALATTVT
jgi:hypothetical protein